MFAGKTPKDFLAYCRQHLPDASLTLGWHWPSGRYERGVVSARVYGDTSEFREACGRLAIEAMLDSFPNPYSATCYALIPQRAEVPYVR